VSTTALVAAVRCRDCLETAAKCQGSGGEDHPSDACVWATSVDSGGLPAHALRRIVMRQRGWRRPLRGICEDHRRGHPSPLVVDPTRVHAALSEPCGPGTFQNAPQDPCCVRGLSCALDYESRGQVARTDSVGHPLMSVHYPPTPAPWEHCVAHCHGMEGFPPLWRALGTYLRSPGLCCRVERVLRGRV
jgi:hypothetical protein